MRFPKMCGLIDRRILCNFRIQPQVLKKILPSPFRPKIKNGFAMGGICLIRLCEIRPHFLPSIMGTTSENAAHRFAVEWDSEDGVREGVYIPRRDTSSRLNALVGGRIFPGVHHHAHFEIHESDNHYSISMTSNDTRVLVQGHSTPTLPKGSIFKSLQEASDFFEQGSLGYSDTHEAGLYDGLELKVKNWRVEALELSNYESSYFSNTEIFPAGSVEFDHALLMLNIQHEWIGRESLSSSLDYEDSAFALTPKDANREQSE